MAGAQHYAKAPLFSTSGDRCHGIIVDRLATGTAKAPSDWRCLRHKAKSNRVTVRHCYCAGDLQFPEIIIIESSCVALNSRNCYFQQQKPEIAIALDCNCIFDQNLLKVRDDSSAMHLNRSASQAPV